MTSATNSLGAPEEGLYRVRGSRGFGCRAFGSWGFGLLTFDATYWCLGGVWHKKATIEAIP